MLMWRALLLIIISVLAGSGAAADKPAVEARLRMESQAGNASGSSPSTAVSEPVGERSYAVSTALKPAVAARMLAELRQRNQNEHSPAEVNVVPAVAFASGLSADRQLPYYSKPALAARSRAENP